ncbi:MAG: alpha/beta hydrolase [Chloroflexota bacterium]
MATSRSSQPHHPSTSAVLAEVTSGTADIHGHRLYWEACGAASWPTVLLLHHGLGSSRAWKAQLPALASQGWRAIAYDRWGYGASDPRPALDVPHFESDVRDLRALLDSLQVDRAALIGHSDGGTIALYFAAQSPARVTALVVVAAHIYVEPSMLPGIQSVAQAFKSDLRFRQGLRRAHGDQAEAVFYNWHQGWLRPENLSWDMRPQLRQVKCPTLVLQGELDEHATPRHAQDLAEAVPQAELWLVPGAHHMLPQEKPDEFNRRVIEFLAPIEAR